MEVPMKADDSRFRELLERLYTSAVASATAAPQRQKALGQYFTDPRVARFMAELPSVPRDSSVRVLDPGAGTGVLGLSAAVRLLEAGVPHVDLYAVERDPHLVPHLIQGLKTAQAAFNDRFTFTLLEHDFLELAEGRLGLAKLPTFQLAISNPPYFKMSPKSGPGGNSPNAYSRFMEMSARLLEPEGQLCFIVPRSFTSGFYFRGFRRSFHEYMALRALHTFDSRADLFRHQEVLQENIIVLYRRSPPQSGVEITSSTNHHDINSPVRFVAPLRAILDRDDAAQNIRVPANPSDLSLLEFFERCRERLAHLGLEISTGPVVPFRATEQLASEPDSTGTFPLLWLQHVKRNQVDWPLGPAFRKSEYIRAKAPRKLLVPNRTYVLLRRFSAKEDLRRLTAAVLPRDLLPGRYLGLENHLNFIHQPGGELEENVAVGLATLLNSELYDRYFRITNGNTQVGAAEIHDLPLPALDVIRQVGKRALATGLDSDAVVLEILAPSIIPDTPALAAAS
jgi:adenine-specific DNA-methyltransferase